MSDQPYDASEQEVFGFVDDDDEGATDESLEEDILDARDYSEADRFGMTPAEERRGGSLEEELAAEVPDEVAEPLDRDPGEPVPDEPPGDYPERP
ncbi:hypothetical protein [Glycomyces paridis]|uniref:DUF5709 domain-containing protein n=1 Tax=Glycomyces paridis TaxID=2126555 RepID=A0A4S8PG02_9ACTN|nr:hypothetical protein [Glycomyces paridis]THV29453.1 hypothetical protein E9998_08025 [Glycomyces paridis]